MKTLLILLLTTFTASAQIARPTINPFSGGGMMMPFQNGFQFPNSTNHPLNFNRPSNNGFQNNFQRPSNYGNGYQQPFNNGFQNNFQQQFNNSFQQQPQMNSLQLSPRRLQINNGYLYGRPTLWYDPKSNKMQPWVRKNLR